MADLKIVEQIEQTITSLEVAEMVGKSHDKLLRDIRNYIEQLGQAKIGESDFFTESTYQNSQNKTQPCYNVTKKGCEFIAHKLTGVKGTEFTAKYINRFHDMEEQLTNPLLGISQELRAVIVVDKRVTQVEERIGKLENNMTVTHEMLQTIKNRVNKKVVTVLGGHESNAYRDKHLRGKVYSRFNRDYCDYFRINARANTLASKFEGALSYIDMWAPDTNLMFQIKDCNAQMSLEVF